MYEFGWIPGGLAPAGLVNEMARLYSQHYGVWGPDGQRPGERVRLSAVRIREHWLSHRDSRIAWARAFGTLVGYAIAIQTRVPGVGVVSWVTQLVVHENHRKNDVGKTLLFTIWGFSNHFAWGLITANPYAVRALEKATRRRALPIEIRKYEDVLLRLGTEVVPYIPSPPETKITSYESRINTHFFLDHSQLAEMLLNVAGENRLWELGPLPEGNEWLAFTFHEQEQIGLTRRELEQMMLASDAATKQAFSRMQVTEEGHTWAKHAEKEIDFIMTTCLLKPGNRLLDFGCGQGRHALGFARRGIDVVGVDYIESFVQSASAKAAASSLTNAKFEMADCREVKLSKDFDVGICLYDVIGTYADEKDNLMVLTNLARHIKPLGYVLLSVMSMGLTERRALNWFSIESEPDKLLSLPPSDLMEKSGAVFDPKLYLIDRNTRIVYRKEQFSAGEGLPQELLVRDMRFTQEQIETLCRTAGLDVVWSRFVRAGKWDQALAPEDEHAKEILVLCRKPAPETDYLFSVDSETAP